MKSYNVILASASPRRAELIKKIPWLNATVFPYNGDEPPFCGGDIYEYVRMLAQIKAQGVFDKTGGVVIGADTVVTINGNVLGKPKTALEADNMFRTLCGKTHSVITGVCIVSGNKKLVRHEVTGVIFNEYNGELVNKYVASGAPFDKAGGYGLQDNQIKPLINRVIGDADNVIGLPVNMLKQMIKEFM